MLLLDSELLSLTYLPNLRGSYRQHDTRKSVA